MEPESNLARDGASRDWGREILSANDIFANMCFSQSLLVVSCPFVYVSIDSKHSLSWFFFNWARISQHQRQPSSLFSLCHSESTHTDYARKYTHTPPASREKAQNNSTNRNSKAVVNYAVQRGLLRTSRENLSALFFAALTRRLWFNYPVMSH